MPGAPVPVVPLMSETVVLLHGIWMPALAMAPLALRLRRHGYRVAVFGYRSLTETLEINAGQLAGFIREQGDATVHLVGHSLGGLVILRALQSHPGLINGRIVLLGSPVKGSVVARRLYRCRGLRWLLGRSADGGLLGSGPVWQGHLPLGVIAGNRPMGVGQIIGGLAGEHDGTVTVAETRLENASGSIQVNATHTGLLVSRGVADEVCSFLKNGHFSQV
jgi:pimeloyl-ACP methyl ester carboxylesterase